MVVLKQSVIRGELKASPVFMRESTGSVADTPRTWFNQDEYRTLITALRKNITLHRNQSGGRWREAAEELRDFVLFISNTGVRIGEANNVRFCDVTIAIEKGDRDGKQTEYLEIRNIKGKRGDFGQCKSYYGAPRPFKRCIARFGLTLENYKQSEEHIFKEYHRDMFRAVLQSAKLYQTQDRPPRKRDLMSLRHTYICFRLLQGRPVFDIANNCRTSVQMITDHYARHLSVLSSTSINKSYDLADDDD
jgi:integrase